MNKWADVIHTIEKNEESKTIDQKLELTNYYYGYIGYLLGLKKYDQAQPLIAKGEKLITEIISASPKNATAYAYKAAFIGFRIVIDKFKVFSLGQESLASVNKAYEIDPKNIQAIIDKGNTLYHTPGIFGGDKQEALIFFLRGMKLMEQTKITDQNWFYLNVLILIARTYEQLDRPQEAKLTYEKILQKEPNHKWVKDELYPLFLAKLKK